MILKKKLKNSWNQWFAGFVDGDGFFYINKKNEISFELTTSTIDVRLLYNIKNMLKGGSVKLRSGSKSARYRVQTRVIIIDIVKRLNGKLQNPVRVKQFQKVCFLINIAFVPSVINVFLDTAYLSGLIDADGTIAISVCKTSSLNSQKPGIEGKIHKLQNSQGFNQIYCKVTSIHKSHMLFIQKSYKIGKIIEQKANKNNKTSNNQYHWIITSYEEFVWISNYLKKNPLKSTKMHRIRLSLLYFQYKSFKYDLKNFQSLEYKMWVKFCKSWFKYNVYTL